MGMLPFISGCCCKEVYIDTCILTIIINFSTPLVSALFLAAASLLLVKRRRWVVWRSHTRFRL